MLTKTSQNCSLNVDETKEKSMMKRKKQFTGYNVKKIRGEKRPKSNSMLIAASVLYVIFGITALIALIVFANELQE